MGVNSGCKCHTTNHFTCPRAANAASGPSCVLFPSLTFSNKIGGPRLEHFEFNHPLLKDIEIEHSVTDLDKAQWHVLTGLVSSIMYFGLGIKHKQLWQSGI